MHLNTNPEYDRNLQAIASDLNYVWGTKPSITALIKAIGKDELTLIKRPQTRSKHYYRLKEQIQKKKPFSLHYIDSQSQVTQFTCLFAELFNFEGSDYLNVWASESHENPTNPELLYNYPELQNNYSLRIDRLPNDANFIEIEVEGLWKEEGLDKIEVQFELFGNMCYAYTRLEGDSREWLSEKHLKVTRKITNIYWFLQTMKRYSPLVKVISPKAIADEYLHDLERAIMSQES
jgi:hypothetical protein